MDRLRSRATVMSSPWLCLAVLLVAVAAARGVAAEAVAPEAVAPEAVAPEAVDGEVPAGGRDASSESVLTMASCVADREAMRCLHRRALRYREQLIGDQRTSMARSLESSASDKDNMMQVAEELFDTIVPDSKEDKDLSNSRGHKLKKKIHKLIKTIKIIVLIVVVKLKMVFVMFMLQTLFQAKLVAITFMILLIKKYYLWIEWKHKKEEKKAVVYYEHAQHQHHYDESDHYHDGLGGLLGHGHEHGYQKGVEPTAEASPGGWGGWWGKRSADASPTMANPVLANPGLGNPALAAQQMAYNAHVPMSG